MEKKLIPIKFGLRWVIFFVLLESSTVPLVAMSNSIAIQNIAYMSIMGFIVAFICVLVLVKLLRNLLIKHSASLLGFAADDIRGLWYISVVAGILLMIMFFVQDIIYAHGYGDYSAGFFSALLSVGISLLIYELVAKLTGFAIKVHSRGEIYQIRFQIRDILILALIFSIYEFFVCPITSIWVPRHEYRVLIAFASGIAGGAFGGVLLYFISRFIPFHARLTLQKNAR